MKLRAATYNIHKCKGLDGRVKPARIVEVLRQIDADIMGLQEVVSVENGTRDHEQGRYIAEELGMHYALGQAKKIPGGMYGNVVLSKAPPSGNSCHDISVSGREPRCCMRVDVDVNGTALHVFNVHMGTDFFERREQGRRMVETELVRSRTLKGPRILMGDFNEWTRGLATHLFNAEFAGGDIRTLLRQARTYPGVIPLMHLDHIYYDAPLQAVEVRLHRTRLALVASDHLPLVADFVLGEKSE